VDAAKAAYFQSGICSRGDRSSLNLELDELDSRFPIQEVSTGVPFIIVPLKTQAALKQIKVNKDRYFELISNSQAKCILVFCPETYNPANT
jgi:trans-2,3-dihydro-3-hydroxyanthranilate isomerase